MPLARGGLCTLMPTVTTGPKIFAFVGDSFLWPLHAAAAVNAYGLMIRSRRLVRQFVTQRLEAIHTLIIYDSFEWPEVQNYCIAVISMKHIYGWRH